jgi:hypothetical protein
MEEIFDFNNLSTDLQDQVMHALAKEFYGTQRLAEGLEAFWRSLTTQRHFIKAVLWEGQLVGASSYKIFEWEQIRAQLYYEARFEDGNLSAIRLRPFATLVDHPTHTPVAEMVAYATILDGYRGRDFYRHLFVAKLQDIVQKSGAGLVFALTRGDYAASDIVQKGTAYMLAREAETHGYQPDGTVNVQGTWVAVEDFAMQTGYSIAPISFATHSRGSQLTTLLAQEHGFVPIGFHRNFSILLVTTPDVIRARLGN